MTSVQITSTVAAPVQSSVWLYGFPDSRICTKFCEFCDKVMSCFRVDSLNFDHRASENKICHGLRIR